MLKNTKSNLIIPRLNDVDYNNIINNYNKSNCIWSEDTGINGYYYFIPPQLVLKNYVTRCTELLSELNSDNDWCNWVGTKILVRVLHDYCNLTLQQYYDTVILHIRYEDERPVCLNCGIPLTFDCMAHGYNLDSNRFCSHSCRGKYYGDRGIIGALRNHKEMFIGMGNPYDECTLYLALIDNGKIKFGVTSQSLQARADQARKLDNIIYKSIHSLYTSTRIDVAELEDNLRNIFDNREFLEYSELHYLILALKSEIPKHRVKYILILSPHPDDSTLAFGGLIHREVNNGSILKEVCFTMGGPSSSASKDVRLSEWISVMEYTHMTEYEYLHEGMDGLLDTLPNCQLTGEIDKLIAEFKPDEVYCCADSVHADHHALYTAFLGSARLKSGWQPRLWCVGSYMFSNQLNFNMDGTGYMFQPLTKEDFDAKCDAFRLYKSQFKPSPNPLGINGITAMTKYYGMLCGHEYAELYYQLKYIRQI